jgi:cytochrome c-type biogenesis protein
VIVARTIELNAGGLLLAFAAGFVSFISPCVLPLVPGYVCFVSGATFDQLGAPSRRVVSLTAMFVLGFTVMFVLLGAGAGWFGNSLLVHRQTLELIAGIFVIVAGLVYAGVPLPRLLAMEKRLHVAEGGTYLTSSLTGVAFAIGWTPCLGPTLAAILTLSIGGSSPTRGAILLAAYSLGLGVPFLLAGLAFTRTLGWTGFVRRHWRAVRVVSASLLIAFGVLLLTGQLFRITTELSRFTGLTF